MAQRSLLTNGHQKYGSGLTNVSLDIRNYCRYFMSIRLCEIDDIQRSSFRFIRSDFFLYYSYRFTDGSAFGKRLRRCQNHRNLFYSSCNGRLLVELIQLEQKIKDGELKISVHHLFIL